MRWERMWKGWERTGIAGRWWHGWWRRWTGRWWRGRWAPDFGFPSCRAGTRRSPDSGRAPLGQTVPERRCDDKDTQHEWKPHRETKRRLDVFVSETYSVQSGQLLGHFSHREVHEVTFVFLLQWRLSVVLLISVLLPQWSTSVLWRRPAAICQTRQIINDKQASKRGFISSTVQRGHIYNPWSLQSTVHQHSPE